MGENNMRMETFTYSKSEALDRKSLTGIYDKYNPMLFRYAYRLLGDQDTAEECVAETFSRFLNSLRGRPEGPDNVQAYLYRVAHNWITDYYRRQPPTESLDPDLHVDPQSNPTTLVAQNAEDERMRCALVQLPQEQRQVIVLRFLEEHSHEEVASIMGKTVEATRAMQYRALSSLRKMLLD